MSTSPKRRRSKPAAPTDEQPTKTTILYLGEDDFLRDIDDALAITPTELVDPAMAAARLLVLRAVEDPVLRADLRAPGRLVTVEVPGAEWVEPVAAAWEEVVLGGGGLYRDGGDIRPWMRRKLRRGEYMRFVRTGTEKSHRHDVGNGDVAHAVAAGAPVVGFASNPARYLPAALVRAADHRVVPPRLDGTVLAAIAASTTGAACAKTLDDDVCRRISPDDLRLARRVGQTPEDYLTRLAALVSAPSGAGDTIRLDDLHGMDAAVEWGRALARDLADYARGELKWRDIDRGALLAGPPGTGKTTWARALAAECDVPLVIGSFARWQASGTGHLGDMLSAMRKCFDDARRQVPSILFIDEIDSVGSREQFSGHNASYNQQVVNAFLELLDGVEGRDGVVVIGACNDPDTIDPAIRRPGRLDRFIKVSLPDLPALGKIFRFHLGADNLADADLASVARLCLGASGADVEQYVRGARRRARTARRPMTIDDLMVEIRGEPSEPNPDAWRTTVHEAGHAVATAILRPGALLGVTVRPVGDIGGATAARDDALPVLSQIEARLVCIMAGRAAERLILGQVSTGSGGDGTSDLARATVVALQTIISFRMHGNEPPTWLGQPESADIGKVLLARPEVAARVDAMLTAAEDGADQFVAAHRKHIEVVAVLLARCESLSGGDVTAIIAETDAQLEAKAGS